MPKPTNQKSKKWFIIGGAIFIFVLFGSILEDAKKDEQEIANRLGRVCAFEIHKVDNHDYGDIRKRRTWHITILGATRPEDFGATTIYAARALQKKTNAGTATVIASMTKEGILEELGQNLAVAHYIPDGKGFSGEGESPVWELNLPLEVPPPEAIAAYRISARVKRNLQSRFPDDFRRQAAEKNKIVSEELGIPVDTVQTFFYLYNPSSSQDYVYQGESLSFISKEAEAAVKAELKK